MGRLGEYFKENGVWFFRFLDDVEEIRDIVTDTETLCKLSDVKSDRIDWTELWGK